MAIILTDTADASHAASTANATAIARVQAWSGLAVAVFVATHLVNTFMAIVSSGAYDSFQRAAASVYQQPVVETALMLALLAHIASGITRMYQLRGKRRLTLRQKLHRYAGVFLMTVVFGHIAAVRGTSWFAEIYPRAAGVNFSLAYLPQIFYVYYFLLAAAGGYHAWQGVQVALRRLGILRGTPGTAAFWSVPLALCLLIGLSLAGLGGWLYEIDDPFDNDFARLYLSFLE